MNRAPKVIGIQGSVRVGNFTAKAMALVADEFERQEISFELIDPQSYHLPLPGTDEGSDEMSELRHKVSEATAVVLATPEYHGAFSSVMKLVIENLGFPSVLAGKPIALLGVAAGQIGAIKSLESLASVCTHIGAIVLPGSVSIANVHQYFDDNDNCVDEKIEKRIRSVATHLIDYLHQNICPRIALEEMVRNTSQE